MTFVYGTRLKVGETKSISVLLETLRIKSSQTSSEERARLLENLLRAVLEDKGTDENPQNELLKVYENKQGHLNLTLWDIHF